jgi:type II restriction enzyme
MSIGSHSGELMTTHKQVLGAKGEVLVVKQCHCPRCKRKRTLRRLPTNFKCADVICDFCGFLAQVKTVSSERIETLPKTILGAAWSVQRERMEAGIYFPLFIVQINDHRKHSIFYLTADMQTPDMFVARRPLSITAKRSGWQGFIYNLTGNERS